MPSVGESKGFMKFYGMTKIGPLKKTQSCKVKKIFSLKSFNALMILQHSLKSISSCYFFGKKKKSYKGNTYNSGVLCFFFNVAG